MPLKTCIIRRIDISKSSRVLPRPCTLAQTAGVIRVDSCFASCVQGEPALVAAHLGFYYIHLGPIRSFPGGSGSLNLAVMEAARSALRSLGLPTTVGLNFLVRKRPHFTGAGAHRVPRRSIPKDSSAWRVHGRCRLCAFVAIGETIPALQRLKVFKRWKSAHSAHSRW